MGYIEDHDLDEHEEYCLNKKTKMAKKTFDQFKKDVENLLMKRHGITVNDCTDDTQLQAEFNDDAKPEEFVEFIADKYDLNRIDQ